MRCPHCDGVAFDDDTLCPACGRRLDGVPDDEAGSLVDACGTTGELPLIASQEASEGAAEPSVTAPIPALVPFRGQGPSPPPAVVFAPGTRGAYLDHRAGSERTFEVLRPRHRGRAVALGLVCAFVVAVLLVGVGYLGHQANLLNEITCDLVAADLTADEGFMRGSASDDFVLPAAYAIDEVALNTKALHEGGVDATATVRLSNGFFSETRHVILRYIKADGQWTYELATESRDVYPVRGVDNDAEYGIEAADAVFDGSDATCWISVPYVDDGTGPWYVTVMGERVFRYAFTGDAWQRIGVDDSYLYNSYQNLVGSYVDGRSSRTQAHFDSFAITSVDDAAGTFEGTFSWKAADGLLRAGRTVTAAMTGTIDASGQVQARGVDSSLALSFEGAATDQGLTIDVRQSYESTLFGLGGSWSRSVGRSTLVKQ